MNRCLSLLLPLVLLSACGGDPAQEATPSVLVTAQAAKQGSAPAILTAYGSAQPSGSGVRTLNSAQPGQVLRLAVTAGSAVRAGQPILTFEVAPTARSAYEQAASALVAAEKQRITTAQLLAQQMVTRDQLVQAEKAVSDARITLAALRREGAGQAIQTMTAPFDGIVTAIPVAPGDRTQAGASLATVTQAGDIVVTVGIEPSDSAKLRVGQSATLHRLTGGTALSGHVIRVDTILNSKTRMIDTDISLPAGAILPGEGLCADIATGAVQGWIVPHKSIVTATGPARLFQIAGGKARAVPVTILQAGEESDIVRGALNPRQPVIVDGAYQVEDGAAVRVGR